jgi:hypothetical protein
MHAKIRYSLKVGGGGAKGGRKRKYTYYFEVLSKTSKREKHAPEGETADSPTMTLSRVP